MIDLSNVDECVLRELFLWLEPSTQAQPTKNAVEASILKYAERRASEYAEVAAFSYASDAVVCAIAQQAHNTAMANVQHKLAELIAKGGK